MTDVAPRPAILPDDHPGIADAAYRSRRAEIAAVGERYRPGDPIPDVHYTADEDEVWATVSAELAVLHQRYACREARAGGARLGLPMRRVPQLREVDARLQALTGFRIRPVPGLVPTRTFYESLADATFCSTQYIRHHSVPRYTPEPDIVHEIIGHATMLASPVFADLYIRAGWAARRCRTEEALACFSRIFWCTLEFGVVREDGQQRAYGAGLLSSFGEIQQFRDADIQEWDLRAMGNLAYDITQYQPVLFAARSFDHLVDALGTCFDQFDDDTYEREYA
jgi:phenylalanine-4-hydroxylase